MEGGHVTMAITCWAHEAVRANARHLLLMQELDHGAASRMAAKLGDVEA